VCQDNLSFPVRPDGGPSDVRTDIPKTGLQAYIVGLEAARRGVDLATVVHDAYLTWPREDLALWSEMITCASLGYWYAETREGGDE
jgi:hypothetical protein